MRRTDKKNFFSVWRDESVSKLHLSMKEKEERERERERKKKRGTERNLARLGSVAQSEGLFCHHHVAAGGGHNSISSSKIMMKTKKKKRKEGIAK